MKKFWIGLIGLILITGSTFAQTLIDKPDKQLTASARVALLSNIETIEAFVLSIGERYDTVSGSELRQLQNMVNSFFSLRENLFKAISLPFPVLTDSDTPKIAFIYECKEAIDKYFSGASWYEDDDAQTVKRFWTKYTGKQMEIEKTKNWEKRIVLGIFAGFGLALLLGFVARAITDENYAIGWVVGIIIFSAWFAICLFVS